MEYLKHPDRGLRHWLSVIFIYFPVLPMFLLDITMEIYHRICFPLYGLPLVDRSKYIIFDRQKLKYLRWYDKVNCTYCAYANGFLPYAARIAGDTEKYWCGIKHQKVALHALEEHQQGYLEYGDKAAFEALQKEGEAKLKQKNNL